ncbi:hypothetical protein ALNOE001_06740 [Candidatus Methanobinarius endosymbioticus]|uniref:Uncharacterized protein n=1 Tax=Candidatus Methanobinarius endosymbioticus TaxID=2006182 RepID=A0A366MC63_9EURY|nr:hypothetical protein ALNOE001_06740 [Candidatus Methanobinarius endosymbioticus]
MKDGIEIGRGFTDSNGQITITYLWIKMEV